LAKRRNPFLYENRLLEIFQKYGPKIQSKKLVDFAKATFTAKDSRGRVQEHKGIGPNTVYFYLNELRNKKIVERVLIDPHHPKEVYYELRRNVRLARMSEELIKEKTKSLLPELQKELEKQIAIEIAYCEKECPFEDEEDKLGFINEIINDDELRLTLGRILVKQGNKLIKTSYLPPGMKERPNLQ